MTCTLKIKENPEAVFSNYFCNIKQFLKVSRFSISQNERSNRSKISTIASVFSNHCAPLRYKRNFASAEEPVKENLILKSFTAISKAHSSFMIFILWWNWKTERKILLPCSVAVKSKNFKKIFIFSVLPFLPHL